MSEISLPPQDHLYRLDQLIKGYDRNRPESILETYSFRQFQAYCPYRTPGPREIDGAMKIAEHDAIVSDSLFRYLYDLCGQPNSMLPVGFMGSSSLGRDKLPFADFARLGRAVSKAGFLVVTGGGPAMMEAASFGAYLANTTDAFFEESLAKLMGSSVPKLRREEIVEPNGDLKPGLDPTIIAEFHRWFADAHEIASEVEDPGQCLAVSTWEYGQEPVMPFATHYAAYFQNSIREAALVRESRVGMVYGQGGGGTVREIFQDVEENYYVKQSSKFTPMVFFDRGSYWAPLAGSANPIGMPVFECTRSIFKNAFERYPHVSWSDKVVSTVDVDQIIGLLLANKPMGQEKAIEFLEAHTAAAPTTFI